MCSESVNYIEKTCLIGDNIALTIYNMKIFLILTLSISFPTWASDKYWLNKHVNISVECESALDRVLGINIATTSSTIIPTIEVGGFNNLEEVFVALGYQIGEIQKWLSLLRKVFSEPEGYILKNMAREIKKAGPDRSRKLVFCIANEACQLQMGAGSFLPFYSNFSMTPENDTYPEHGVYSVPGIPTAQLGQNTNFVLANKSPNLIRHLIHELVHFADWQLLNRWVAINKMLHITGKTLDPLYLKYSREHRGRIYIDRHFVRVFLESRAYLAEFHLSFYYFQEQISDLRMAELKTKYVNSFFEEIKDSQALHVLNELGVNENNFINFVEIMNSEIQKTLSRFNIDRP